MAEAVAGLLTSAFVNIAKDKLGSGIVEQANLLRNFGGDLEDMKDVLETISAVLEDAERRSVKERLVRLWLKRLKNAALDISDMLEEYRDSSDQASAKLPGVLSCLPIAYKRIAVANRMKSMREKMSKINKEFKSFKFITEGTGSKVMHHYDERETTSDLFPEESVKGRDVEKMEITNLLSARTNNGETKIVAIYGLGGMGKSTLARLLYKDTQSQKYDYRIWVYVSQDFDLLKIGNSIISQLSIGGQENRDSLQVINLCLRNLLSSKKVLIILDDLWEEKGIELDKLRSMLHVEGSMIDVIVTTRKEDIALKVSTSGPYKLQPLTNDICWEIIKRSSKFERKPNKKNLELIGMDIAKKCGGVALAAQAIGYMLQSIDDMDTWTKIKNSDIWKESSEDDVLPSLKLSYERMPQQLRICFSYCAIFSKGYNIVEDDLIHQWISLDFIEPSKGKEYINQLLSMSFLQVLPLFSKEQVVRYTMHDLVHDLARLSMADDLIVFNDALERNARGLKYCRYALLRKYDRTEKLSNILPSKMRALRFSHSGELDIPSGAFSFAKWLRTLDFSECSGISLPVSIGQLKQLRCLIAPKVQNESLPECITEQSKLQYLNINGSSKICTLPESIGKLGSLKHLALSGCVGISKLPESFGDLKSMVHLDMSNCSGIQELPDSLGNLTNLQHLELSGCSSVQAIPESFCGLTQVQYLNLSHCGCLDRLPQAIGNLADIKYFNISWCEEIRELPESLMKVQNLLHLDLSGCKSMREASLGGLHGLTTLQHLNMSLLFHINIDHEYLSDVLGNLTNLKFLSLQNISTQSNFVVDFISALTNLEHLDLSANFGLACLPESIGNLKRLHTLALNHCNKLKSLPESIGALELKSLELDECSNELMDQASSMLHYSQTLPVFRVRADDVNGCSNLHLLEGVHVSELRIRSLENVRSLEEANKVKLLDKHNLSRLKLAWTVDAVRLLEDIDLLGQLVPPSALEDMCLAGYSSTSFPGWLMSISDHLANLVSIDLSDLPTCSSLPPLGQLPQLENLSLWNLSSIKKIDKEFCGGKEAFRRLSKVFISNMEGLEEWNTTFSMEDGVEEFMFPVLDSLTLQDCPRLRLKPCPPTFRDCTIRRSDQVISSLEEVDKITDGLYLGRETKLYLVLEGDYCQSMRMLHHFPGLQELNLVHCSMTNLPESMRHLTSLQSLALSLCGGLSALPEWLSNLSSLKRLDICRCPTIKALPPCIQQLTKLQKLEIRCSQELKKWCESEENKMKLAHIKVEIYGDY